MKNPRFLGIKLPEISKSEVLEKRFLGKLSKKAFAFAKDLLKIDPNKRISAEEAV